MTSYYLRRSTDYDTLLQMGRWFGYRHGFEDLTRIFTSVELAQWFQDLAIVEDELRDAIKRYEDEGLSPVQMAISIRAHRSMRVTSPRKQGAGTVVQSSFSEGLVQTIWFPLDEPTALENNVRAAEGMTRELTRLNLTQVAPGWLARKVPCQIVLDFLRAYTFVPQRETGGQSLDPDQLIEYISRQFAAGELQTWNALRTQEESGCVAGPVIHHLNHSAIFGN